MRCASTVGTGEAGIFSQTVINPFSARRMPTCWSWRYIHLNPLRAKLVGSMAELDRFEFCGPGVILGKQQKHWQDVDKLLGVFGKRVGEARRNYHTYVEGGIEQGRRADLVGGGLNRSSGGWQAVKAMRRLRIHAKGDERILGKAISCCRF
jgi:putative transposase